MAQMKYLDFDVAIERSPEGYRTTALTWPTGEATAGFVLPFSDLEVENFLLRMGRPLSGVRRAEAPDVQAAKEFGGKLYRALFEGGVGQCLERSLAAATQQGAGLRIRLRLADVPELATLPWEYLYNPDTNRFLALSAETPIVRRLSIPEDLPPLAIQLPLRILVIIVSPTDLPALAVGQEWERLNRSLADLQQTGRVTLERLPRVESPAEPVTLAALQRALRRGSYHILHFIGHGGFDPASQDGFLLLQDDTGHSRPVNGEYLGTILHDERTLRLAVLNACEGGRAARDDPFAGVAQSLIQQGVPAVIAMQFAISDEAAIACGHEFYMALAEGYPVDTALAEARRIIYSEGMGTEWGTPVLYTRALDGRLFELAAASATDAAAEVPRPEPASAEARFPEPSRPAVSPPARPAPAAPTAPISGQRPSGAGRRGLPMMVAIVVAALALLAGGIFAGTRLFRPAGPTATRETLSGRVLLTGTPLIAPATPTRTALPAPSRTVTPTMPPPSRTVTPTMPSRTVTPTMPSRTVTPTTPSGAATCRALTDPLFVMTAWAANLGCATGDAQQITAAWQPFSQGHMLWRKDTGKITVLTGINSGTWTEYADAWREGTPEVACTQPADSPPAVRGFGLIWCKEAGIRTALGSALAGEVGGAWWLQPFNQSVALRVPDWRNGVLVLEYSGGWKRLNIVPSETTVVNRYGDFTPCITKNQHQVKCFVSDGKSGSPNQGSIEIEPRIVIWGKCQAEQVKQFQINPTGPAHEFTCSKTEAGWFHY